MTDSTSKSYHSRARLHLNRVKGNFPLCEEFYSKILNIEIDILNYIQLNNIRTIVNSIEIYKINNIYSINLPPFDNWRCFLYNSVIVKHMNIYNTKY